VADENRSNAILEKMKRSLGLHCTILRLNTVQDEKDVIPLRKSSWISAGEELGYLANSGKKSPSISTADKLALEKFVRDMVTQSIVPHMERCITMWNDQVLVLSAFGLIGLDSIVSSRIGRKSFHCIPSPIQ
jgi:trafficking protein particle complex subunit 8